MGGDRQHMLVWMRRIEFIFYNFLLVKSIYTLVYIV